MTYLQALLSEDPNPYPSCPESHRTFRALPQAEKNKLGKIHYAQASVVQYLDRLAYVESTHISELRLCCQYLPEVSDPDDRQKLKSKIDNWVKVIRSNLSGITVNRKLFENICRQYGLDGWSVAQRQADEWGGEVVTQEGVV